MHVLVTDDGYKATLGIVRSLGRKGIRVSVLSDSPIRLASHSRYCSGRHVVPPASDPSYCVSILKLVQSLQFDLVMPVGYVSSLALAKYRRALEAYTRLEIADYALLHDAADKIWTGKLAGEIGVPVPPAVLPTSFGEIVEQSRTFRYPVVIKMPRETPCSLVLYAHTRAQLLDMYRVICEHASSDGAALPMVQEFISGFGCGFFALYDRGHCKRIFMHKRIRETPPSGGASCCASSFYDERLKEYGLRLLDRLNWHGVAMAEFRYDERDGQYKLLEINPKFWGSLDLAVAAGVDFPYALCQMAAGKRLDYSESYKRKLRYHWPLPELQHTWQYPPSLAAVLTDLLNPAVKSNFWWSDPKPNLIEPLSRLRPQTRASLIRKPSPQSSSAIAGRLDS